MKLHDLINVGSNRSTKRRGRGQGSGQGGTSGRGHKGGKARSGYSPAPCCSGIPYYRRLPKRGFKRGAFETHFAAVNLNMLARLSEKYSEIDQNVLKREGIVRANEVFIKVLGDGELTKSVKVVANRFSVKAREKIEAVGGTAEELVLS